MTKAGQNGSPSPTNWAALAGRWSFDAGGARYHGPTSVEGPTFGLAVSNVELRDAHVEGTVRFAQLKDASAGIVLGYRSETQPYLIAQLGGYSQAYSLASFEPGFGWRALVAAGSITNLQVDRAYRMEVRQRGQRVRMSVDGVSIFDHVLPQPLPGHQLGLYAFGAHPVTFHDVFVHAGHRPRAFVAMAFQEPFDTLYREVLKPETEELGFDVIRIDEKAGPGIIFEDIKREIEESNVVIAEITAPNQNVYYELGYAHALNKPTVLLAQRGKELPFDIRSYRVIFYDDSIGGKPEVERQLREHLHAIVNTSGR